MTFLDDCKEMIRRKAKRIQRASNKLEEIEQDVRLSDGIEQEEKGYLMKQLKELSNYLKNDDKKENKYNYDNQNPKKGGEKMKKESIYSEEELVMLQEIQLENPNEKQYECGGEFFDFYYDLDNHGGVERLDEDNEKCIIVQVKKDLSFAQVVNRGLDYKEIEPHEFLEIVKKLNSLSKHLNFN